MHDQDHTNPYAAPAATAAPPMPDPFAGLGALEMVKVRNAEKHIRNGAVAGSISIVVTLVVLVIALTTNSEILAGMGVDAVGFIDLGLMAAFCFGLYMKSRICAGLLMALFLLEKLIAMVEYGQSPGILGIVIAWFLIRAFVGTIQYHQLRRQSAKALRAAPVSA